MKFSVDRHALIDALSVASIAVTKDPGTATSSALFTVTGTDVMIRTSDRRVLTSIPLPPTAVTGSEGEGSFMVEVSRLQQWVSNVFHDDVAISIAEGSSEVEMKCGTAKTFFRSIDPSAFPDFDNQYKDAEDLFKTSVISLIAALSFVKPFVGSGSDRNDVVDNLQLAELRGNRVIGTDTKILALYQSASLDADFKVGRDEIQKVIAFLKKADSLDVEVLGSDNLFFLRTGKNSVFGFTKPLKSQPDLSGVKGELIEKDIWEASKKDISRAVGALTATADPNDTVLGITIEGTGADSTLTLSMRDFSEKHDSVIQIPCTRIKGEATESFKVNHTFLTQPLSLYTEDTVNFALNLDGKYIKLHEETDAGDIKACLITLNLSM